MDAQSLAAIASAVRDITVSAVLAVGLVYQTRELKSMIALILAELRDRYERAENRVDHLLNITPLPDDRHKIVVPTGYRNTPRDTAA